MDTKKKQK